MNSALRSSIEEAVAVYAREGLFPPPLAATLLAFVDSYLGAIAASNGEEKPALERLFCFLELVAGQLRSPYLFPLYHAAERSPFDYYRFALDFMAALIDRRQSRFVGEELLEPIEGLLDQGDNVVLLANHQIEPDPQVVSLFLEQRHPRLAGGLTAVAGHRVTSDPLAVPISRGCNLISIWSKKYMDEPPQLKEEKIAHNRQSLAELARLFKEGGQLIYIAPSGGRDRPNEEGNLLPALFDPQSIEMLMLLSSKAAEHPVHFFPLALKTHKLLPPPDVVHSELGESRLVNYGPVHLGIGRRYSEEELALPQASSVHEKRLHRTDRAIRLWKILLHLYEEL